MTPPRSVLDDPEAAVRWFESYVLEHHGELLADRARRQFDNLAPMLATRSDDAGVVVLDGRPDRAALVAPTQAVVRGGTVVPGNYLADGPHWFLLREELDHICANALPIAEARLHRWFPDGAAADTVETARRSSERLAKERSLVFPHEVRVDVEDTTLTLTFSPLVASGSVSGGRQWWEKKSGVSSLEVPFRYEHAGAVFDGALRLAPAATPLSCDWRQRSDVPTLIRAWSLALEAYAELTCPAPAPVSVRRPAERRQAVSGRRRSTSRTRDLRAPKSGSVTLPRGFTPLGETARFLGSYVAGHRRQLPLDWTHSDEAAANAAKYGIRLADHETWVEPHTRGMPQQARLHFRWTREVRAAR